jgi:hypothetical protein
VDADVIFAGAASPSKHSASSVVLRMAEITLIEALTSRQAVTEVERNLSAKLPEASTTFRLLVERCLTVVPDPDPAFLASHAGLADPKDLPILVAALLVTFNVKDFQPGHPDVTVSRPGELVRRVRDLLGCLTLEQER